MESNMLAIRDLMRVVADAASLPKLRQWIAVHQGHAEVGWTHRPADLWLPGMRCLADGSRNEPIPHGGEHY